MKSFCTQNYIMYTFHTTNEYFPTLKIFIFFDGFPQLFHGICIYYIIRCITRIKCLCSVPIDPFKNIGITLLMLCIHEFATTVCIYKTQVYKPWSIFLKLIFGLKYEGHSYCAFGIQFTVWNEITFVLRLKTINNFVSEAYTWL